jgi:putative phage-type endonuclease
MTALPVIQNTPEWLDARRDVIGSSDIPIITGSSPYRTSLFSLWAVKTRLAEPEIPDATTQELFDLGHALEPVIAARYAQISGRQVRRARRMLVDRKRRWMGASLDFVSAQKGDRRIVEIKWAPFRRWAHDGPEPVPAHVQDQVQWQLDVSKYDAADVAVMSGAHVEAYSVEPSAAYQDNLRFLGRDFWDLVERRERPPIDGSDETRGVILQLHPRDTLGLMSPNVEVAALAHALRDATKALKVAKEEDGRLRNELRWMLEDYAGVEDDDYRIHFRKAADRIVELTNWEGIVAEYDALLRTIEDAVIADDLGAANAAFLGSDPETIRSRHTTKETKEGGRSLTPKFRDDETGRWI